MVLYQTDGPAGARSALAPTAGMPGRATFWPVFKFVPHFTHMMARGETSFPQFGHVGLPVSPIWGGGAIGGAAVAAALRIASAGAGGGGAVATPTGVGTTIWDWQAGQGISIPAYSGPH